MSSRLVNGFLWSCILPQHPQLQGPSAARAGTQQPRRCQSCTHRSRDAVWEPQVSAEPGLTAGAQRQCRGVGEGL